MAVMLEYIQEDGNSDSALSKYKKIFFKLSNSIMM